MVHNVFSLQTSRTCKIVRKKTDTFYVTDMAGFEASHEAFIYAILLYISVCEMLLCILHPKLTPSRTCTVHKVRENYL